MHTFLLSAENWYLVCFGVGLVLSLLTFFGGFGHFVEELVECYEVRPFDIPMGLLALQVKFDEIDQNPLEVLGKR